MDCFKVKLWNYIKKNNLINSVICIKIDKDV